MSFNLRRTDLRILLFDRVEAPPPQPPFSYCSPGALRQVRHTAERCDYGSMPAAVAPVLCAGQQPPPFEKEDRRGFSYLFRRNDLRIVLFRPCGIAGGPGIFALLRPPREETMLRDPEVRLLPKGRVKHPTMTLRCVRPGSNPTMPPLRTNAYCSFGY